MGHTALTAVTKNNPTTAKIARNIAIFNQQLAPAPLNVCSWVYTRQGWLRRLHPMYSRIYNHSLIDLIPTLLVFAAAIRANRLLASAEIRAELSQTQRGAFNEEWAHPLLLPWKLSVLFDIQPGTSKPFAAAISRALLFTFAPILQFWSVQSVCVTLASSLLITNFSLLGFISRYTHLIVSPPCKRPWATTYEATKNENIGRNKEEYDIFHGRQGGIYYIFHKRHQISSISAQYFH